MRRAVVRGCAAFVCHHSIALSGEIAAALPWPDDYHRRRLECDACEKRIQETSEVVFLKRGRDFSRGRDATAVDGSRADLFSRLKSAIENRKLNEAGAGIEPANSGFADRDLTTWLPRPHFRQGNYRMRPAAVNLRRSGRDGDLTI